MARLLRASLALSFSCLLVAATRAQEQSANTLPLMPEPVSVQLGSGALPIATTWSVALPQTSSPRLQAAVLRALKRLEDKSGTPLPRSIPAGKTGTLTVNAASEGNPVQTIDEDESYILTSTATGVTIQAATATGAMRGLETLVQLAQRTPNGYVIPAVAIQDSPRFRWRGLMIDCSRHFEPIDVLKRNIDAMATVKLNVFHWHLADDQGFRIESKVFPKLTGLGSDGLFYTQEEARDLVRYAHDRGIRVVPEFEMPGHSVAWLVAYPELNSGTKPDGIRREFGISDVALDPTRDETYSFIDKLLHEMVTVFPDQYVHIGGDETPAPDWNQNPRILEFKAKHRLANNSALQAYFNQRILKILTGLNRRMIGWDEIFDPALPKDIVIQSWRGEESLAKGAQQGYQGILSAPYYLDAMKPASQMYLADPIPADTKLSVAEQKLILGGEMTMWAEQIDLHTIDSRIWPRAAAIAERFWSAQNLRDTDNMYARLEPVSISLESLGLQHLSNTDAGLRSLAGTTDISALRPFALAFEPVSFSGRYEEQHTSFLTPLTGFVDAVTPDPPIRHRLDLAASVFAKDRTGKSPDAQEARRQLNSFFGNLAVVLPTARSLAAAQPRLHEMAPRIEQLQQLLPIAQQAMEALETGKAPSTAWKTESLARINESRKPSGIVRFTFLDALQTLIEAVPVDAVAAR